MPKILRAESEEHIESIRALFREYADFLDFDLCFQDFEQELAGLPGPYGPPNGCLLLALLDGRAAGCVAMRRIGEGIAEMKRLFVRAKCRGSGLGRELALAIIEEARKSGYAIMRLDTVPSLSAAIALYRSLGFKDIDAYCHNPIAGALYMELNLLENR